MYLLSVLILPLVYFLSCSGHTVFLDGEDWKLTNKQGISVSARVPGNVYKDLQRNAIIADPLYRFNDYNYRWVALANWTYTKSFHVSPESVAGRVVRLVLEGVDTVASVVLNGWKVATVHNMFLQHRIEVTDILQTGDNELRVEFMSGVTWAQDRSRHHPYPVPPDCPPDVQNGSCHFNFIRKAAYSFSWDWGPNFPGVGIWNSVYLETHARVFLHHLTYQALLDSTSQSWLVEIQCEMAVEGFAVVVMEVSQEDLSIFRQQDIHLTPGTNNHSFHLSIPASRVELWWPIGMGEARLYDFKVVMEMKKRRREDDRESEKINKRSKQMDGRMKSRVGMGRDSDSLWQRVLRVGFRSVELVQDAVGGGGLTFYFKVNNKALFVKGSNWIPTSNFLFFKKEDEDDDDGEKINHDNDDGKLNENKGDGKMKHSDDVKMKDDDDDDYDDGMKKDGEDGYDEYKRRVDWLLKSVVDANMNMLRVWGGGVYESEYFYNRADELGVMIWQDFLFACALYPADDDVERGGQKKGEEDEKKGKKQEEEEEEKEGEEEKGEKTEGEEEEEKKQEGENGASGEGFMASVQEEVSQQVWRLKRHPSILVWAGNNENEGALAYNWFNVSERSYHTYKRDYRRLYVALIRRLTRDIDPSRPFVLSSPSNGLQSEAQGWVARDPQSSLYGDVHFYNYTVDLWDVDNLPTPRFASEFGVQSWPSYHSLLPVSRRSRRRGDGKKRKKEKENEEGGEMKEKNDDEEEDDGEEEEDDGDEEEDDGDDLRLMSEFVLHRQHHQNGEVEMLLAIVRHFDLRHYDNKTQEFIDYIYLGQINQAMSVKLQVEHYRRASGGLWRQQTGVFEGGGVMEEHREAGRNTTHSSRGGLEGFTMGSLYWQLNDVWQAPSWSSIEYSGQWKMLHYYAKKFYATFLVSSYFHKNKNKINLNNNNKNKNESSDNHVDNKGDDDSMMVYFTRDDVYGGTTAGSEFMLTLECYDFDGQLKMAWSHFFRQTTSSALVYSLKRAQLPGHCACHQNDLQHHFLILKIRDKQERFLSSNFQFLTKYIQPSNVSAPSVQVTLVEAINEYKVNIVLRCRKVCFFVWLESPGILGTFSDNGFIMTTLQSNVTFEGKSKIKDIKAFEGALNVRSLSDLYTRE